jgi:putative SOS response-associated peptidase YedK
MCGRFSLTAAAADVEACFEVPPFGELTPRYNIAPSQDVVVVRLSASGGRELRLMRWGLVPAFAKDLSVGHRLINARADALATRPALREAFRHRRCLVIASGFYEWQAGPYGKTPYYLSSPDGALFAFAGLWDRWRSPARGLVESCTIITTDPNELVRALHDRMPVVLTPQQAREWLDPRTEPARLKALLGPPPDSALIAFPVSTLVNRPENDVPECLQPWPPSFKAGL